MSSSSQHKKTFKAKEYTNTSNFNAEIARDMLINSSITDKDRGMSHNDQDKSKEANLALGPSRIPSRNQIQKRK